MLAHESVLGPDFSGIHLTHVTDDEIRLLAESHTIADSLRHDGAQSG